MDMEDARIVELYFARDEQAIRETDAKYGRLCHQIAGNILRNAEDAEECVSDTYWSVWNQIPPARPAHLMAYVCKITRNLSLKKLEFLSALKRKPQAVISISELENVCPDPGQAGLEDADLGRLISDFLRSEKTEARNVFLRRYWFFDSVSDIGARYGYSESKVKSMLLRTRNRLRAYLKKEGVTV